MLDLQSGDVTVIETLSKIEHGSLSSDSRHLVTLSENQLLQVWNQSTKELEMSMQLDISSRYNLFFSPTDKYIVATGVNRSTDDKRKSVESAPRALFTVWQSKDLVEEACARVTRNLTPEEWKQFIGNEDYQKTCSNLP